MAHEERRDVHRDLSHDELELHQLMLRRSKLKSTVRTSTLLAGFAIVAMVEVELNNSHSNGLLIPFAMVTSILIFVHVLSLMLATHILPELDALSAVPHVQLTRRPGNVAQGFCIKMTWFLSHTLGIILFLVQFVLLAFVKFYPINDNTEDRYHAAIAAGVVIITLTVITSLATLVWYYRSYVHRNVKGHVEALHTAHNILQLLNANDPMHPANRVNRLHRSRSTIV